MLSLLVALAAAGSTLAAPTTGTFNVVTMNVAGLPAILNGNDIPGDKTVNTGIIGSKFSAGNYSIIHVQEDFNFHAALYAADDHPYRTATSGGVPFGSGLNTLSLFDWIDFERTKWNTCSISGGDCLTPKGFTFMRVKVSEGVWVDAYNLHTDAGYVVVTFIESCITNLSSACLSCPCSVNILFTCSCSDFLLLLHLLLSSAIGSP
jgi:hypothetical protein